MSLKNNQHHNEIDLIDIFLIIWDYKFKIFIFILIPVIAMFLYLTNQPSKKPYYIAKTKIKPIKPKKNGIM